MIRDYINKLLENIPIEKQSSPVKIDVIFGGGVFNGSYLVGIAYFLKEMEKKGLIKVERISGCSVGSMVGLLYFADKLDLFSDLYTEILSGVKENYKLDYFRTFYRKVCPELPDNLLDCIKDRFYINYYDISKMKMIVKNKFTTVDYIFNSINKSCFVPLLINGSLLYKNKYMDGINPYIFPQTKERKILYVDLQGYDKLFHCINVKNEKTNFHRIILGILDIHQFIIKNGATSMCSYVNDWSLFHRCYNFTKTCLEKLFVCIIYIILCLRLWIPQTTYENHAVYRIVKTIIYEIYKVFCDSYLL